MNPGKGRSCQMPKCCPRVSEISKARKWRQKLDKIFTLGLSSNFQLNKKNSTVIEKRNFLKVFEFFRKTFVFWQKAFCEWNEKNHLLIISNSLAINWCWSSGQHAGLLLQRYKFESRKSLQFSVKMSFENN